MINSLIKWAQNEDSIRTAILVGSRARIQKADRLSDYDISLFVVDTGPFLSDGQWLSRIGPVWICVEEKVQLFNQEYPSRLVIFEGGIKVDFSFFPLNVLDNLIKTSNLPAEYDMGYQVLLDKDDCTSRMPKPAFKGFAHKPEYRQFVDLVNEFWFEAYHVAVYLTRGDFWSANYRLSGIHYQFLLKMIEWYEVSVHKNQNILFQGKKMHSWVSRNTWNGLSGVFAPLDEKEQWKALFNTIDLFKELAVQTAQKLGYTYPEQVDKNLLTFIQGLHENG